MILGMGMLLSNGYVGKVGSLTIEIFNDSGAPVTQKYFS